MKKTTVTKKTKTVKKQKMIRVMEMEFDGKDGHKAVLLITATKLPTNVQIAEVLGTAQANLFNSVLRAHMKAEKTGKNKFVHTEGSLK